MKSVSIVGLVVACLSLPWGSDTVHARSNLSEPLRVLVRIAPPFVIDDGNGDYSGISMDLWRGIAENLQLPYEIKAVELDEMLDRVAKGAADVGVGATTVTSEREERLDFSHPFIWSGLAIAVRSGESPWTGVLSRLLSPAFARAVGTLALVLLAVGALVWLFERRVNPEQFEVRPGRGLWSSFWFAAVSMTTVGYGDKAPRSVGGRIVTLVWMFASILLISFFTAAIATALTVHSLASGIEGPEDLHGTKVGAIENTTGVGYLEQRGIQAEEFSTPEGALRALADGAIDAVVHDEPILRWVLRQSEDARVRVLPQVIQRQAYAFVLPPGSPLREQFNRLLLDQIESERFRRNQDFYVGE